MKRNMEKDYAVVKGIPTPDVLHFEGREFHSDLDSVPLAVFDFDRTCIAGRSPLRLTHHLVKTRQIKSASLLKMLAWGACYKLHLPQNESWVRQQVFETFAGKPKDKVDHYLGQFYDDHIEKLFRPEMDQLIRLRNEEGCFTITVSASFEPILQRCLEVHPFHAQISTRMKTDINGLYTNEVDGLPVEGEEKVRRLKEYADKRFGQGKWYVAWAYSDHYSDAPLLRMAEHPVAVDPDSTLTRTAKREGWDILPF